MLNPALVIASFAWETVMPVTSGMTADSRSYSLPRYSTTVEPFGILLPEAGICVETVAPLAGSPT